MENINRALRMLKERDFYHTLEAKRLEGVVSETHHIQAMAYRSATMILEAAINDDIEMLNQFDYVSTLLEEMTWEEEEETDDL